MPWATATALTESPDADRTGDTPRLRGIAGDLMSIDAKPVEGVQVAPGSLWSEQQVGEPDTSGVLLPARRTGDDEWAGATGHHGREDHSREVPGVVGVGVREQHRLQLRGVDPNLTQALEGTAAAVHEQDRPAVEDDDVGRGCPLRSNEWPAAAQDQQLQRGHPDAPSSATGGCYSAEPGSAI